MFGNFQNNIAQQIIKLKYAIQSDNMKYLVDALNEADQKFYLDGIVMAKLLADNNGVLRTEGIIPKYGNYVSLANEYIEILQDELGYLQNPHLLYTSFSQRAINLLYSNRENFTPDQPLYHKNEKTLTVSKCLSVISYAKNVIEMLGVEIEGKYSVALIVLKSIDLALKNRKQDKPLNKALHLTKDVMSEVLKKAIDDENAKRVVSGASVLVDLTIDFLIKE